MAISNYEINLYGALIFCLVLGSILLFIFGVQWWDKLKEKRRLKLEKQRQEELVRRNLASISAFMKTCPYYKDIK